MSELYKIAIVGTSGSGKTTLARRISQQWAIPHVELDALHWEPNWTEATIDVFRSRVEQALSGDTWVVDGNYSKIRPLVWSRADTIVWLDYSFAIVMRQILQRTIRRVVLQEDCCNGNRETFQTSFLSRDSVDFLQKSEKSVQVGQGGKANDLRTSPRPQTRSL